MKEDTTDSSRVVLQLPHYQDLLNVQLDPTGFSRVEFQFQPWLTETLRAKLRLHAAKAGGVCIAVWSALCSEEIETPRD